jgi:hypothetical protein
MLVILRIAFLLILDGSSTCKKEEEIQGSNYIALNNRDHAAFTAHAAVPASYSQFQPSQMALVANLHYT